MSLMAEIGQKAFNLGVPLATMWMSLIAATSAACTAISTMTTMAN